MFEKLTIMASDVPTEDFSDYPQNKIKEFIKDIEERRERNKLDLPWGLFNIEYDYDCEVAIKHLKKYLK